MAFSLHAPQPPYDATSMCPVLSSLEKPLHYCCSNSADGVFTAYPSIFKGEGALKDPTLEFELLRPAVPKLRVIPHFPKPGAKSTLEEEELVPSALLKFKPAETEASVFTGLTNELLEASEPLTSEAALL
ncbi:hypothetical protein ZIOFF_069867 [Zingiber officinale]|uniref:Uncharacterized protein n=1 Tax=Zingiber officinale TaxID=94328 RepID=A0A8J5C4Q3_ZINOF|nr:hypothetical protein ZIOFF_069867 [Zingiber officinale]